MVHGVTPGANLGNLCFTFYSFRMLLLCVGYKAAPVLGQVLGYLPTLSNDIFPFPLHDHQMPLFTSRMMSVSP